MPAKDNHFWLRRQKVTDPCHYMDKWTDWYAQVVRRRGVRRIWPHHAQVSKTLDVGCGDGQVSEWMLNTFRTAVVGSDAFEYPGVKQRVNAFYRVDGENLQDVFSGQRFDLVTCHTSLCCMKDWQASVRQIAQLTDRVLVVENVQTPTPRWQTHWPQKTHLELPVLLTGFSLSGFVPVAIQPINWLDRGLLVQWPFRLGILKPLGVLLTMLVDWLMVDVARIEPERGRYAAILFEKADRVKAGQVGEQLVQGLRDRLEGGPLTFTRRVMP